MELKWLEHNKKRVLFVDYTGIKIEKEMINHLNSAVAEVLNYEKDKVLLLLSDLTGCYATSGFMDAAKKVEKEVLSKYQVKQAILGITGAKEILLKGFNLISKSKLVPFHDRTEALNFLTK